MKANDLLEKSIIYKGNSCNYTTNYQSNEKTLQEVLNKNTVFPHFPVFFTHEFCLKIKIYIY